MSVARRLALAAIVATAVAGALVPATAHAAEVTTMNACQYSYDDLWRPLPITLGGQASVASARAGDDVTLSSRTFAVDLPAWLAETGYQFGLLRAGDNELDVSVWVAVRGTNTVEQARWERLDGTAETTIETDSSGRFVSATPITYSVSPPPPSTWEAKGGQVGFAQAPSGSLPAIPVGPQDSLRTPKGSIFILARLGETLRLGFDCAAGVNDADGGGYVPATAAPFATTDVPAFECLGAVPPATNLTGVEAELLGPASAGAATRGTPYAVGGSLRYRVPNATLAELYAAGRLAVGDNAFAATFDVALAATNASPATQAVRMQTGEAVTVRVGAGGSPISVLGPGGTSADVSGTLALPSTTWLPAAAGVLSVGVANAGALAPLTPEGTSGSVAPYGSVYARMRLTPAGEAPRYLSADCVSGRTGVANPAIAYSERGDQPAGDQGRFAVASYLADPFVTVGVAEPAPPPGQGPGPGEPGPSPGAVPPPAPDLTAPATTPPAATPKATSARPAVRSTRLVVRRGRIAVLVDCRGGSAACRGTLTIRTAARVRLGGRLRVVTLTRTAGYSVRSGATKTVSLTLGLDGRRLTAVRRSLRVRVLARPASGTIVSKLLTLRR